MPNIPYSEFSFDNLVKNLSNQLAKEPTWTDAYRSSTGQTLIELFAYVGDVMHYSLERAIEESYLDTARLESSIVRAAKLLNYQPQRRVSASCTVRFTLPAAHGYNIIIPRGTVVTDDENSLKFIVNEDTSINAGETFKDINCVEGSLYEVQITSSGQASQSYVLESTVIENTGVRLYVTHGSADTAWELVDALLPTATKEGIQFQAFEVNELPNKYLLVKLGDGDFGQIPEQGDTITIEYLVSKGLEGNIASTGVLTRIVNAIYDSTGAIYAQLTCSNVTPATGGIERETAADIKSLAPLVFQTGDRAVTKLDHEALLKLDTSVDKVYIEAERDLFPPNYDMFNRVNIYLLRKLDNTGVPQAVTDEWLFGSSTDASMTKPDKGTLLGNLYDKGMISIRYEAYEGTIIKFDVDMNAYVRYGQDLTIARTNVETALRDALSYDAAELNQDIIRSVVTSQANLASGITYTEVDMKVYSPVTVTSGNVSSFTLPLLPVAKSNFYLYVNGVMVGKDDGAGSIVTAGEYLSVTPHPYTVNSGNIDYVTGVINAMFATPIPSGNTVSAKYKQSREQVKTIKNSLLSVPYTHQIVDYNTYVPIVPGSLVISADGTPIAQDDYSGNVITYNGSLSSRYSVDTGTGDNDINYTTGTIQAYVNYNGSTPTDDIPTRAVFTIEYAQSIPSDDITVGPTQCAVLNNIYTTMKYIGE